MSKIFLMNQGDSSGSGWDGVQGKIIRNKIYVQLPNTNDHTVVSSVNLGGIPWIIGGQGYLDDPGNIQDISVSKHATDAAGAASEYPSFALFNPRRIPYTFAPYKLPSVGVLVRHYLDGFWNLNVTFQLTDNGFDIEVSGGLAGRNTPYIGDGVYIVYYAVV